MRALGDNAGLYRRAFPFWVALAVITAVLNPLGAIPRESLSGGRLLAGIEPITVLKALFEQARTLGPGHALFRLTRLGSPGG